MRPIEHDRPRAHLVVDDFFGPEQVATVFAELPSLARKMKPGLVRDIGHDGQSIFFENERRKNMAVWIHEPATTLRIFREQLWSAPMLEWLDQAREPLFQIIGNCWAPSLQVSSYMTGDHYAFHEDEGAGVNLTTIVFLAADPQKVRGGDLVLAYGGVETKIRFRHNRLVVFPSKTPHCVTPVRVDSTDPRHARISLQCWLAHGRPPAEASPRPAEANQPTFLLAEPSILAAAQAIDTNADQTPEDLYWGVFYLTRILTQNLRALVAALDLELGPIRIRRREALEVHARLQGDKRRVGFRLHRAGLTLFVDTASRDVPAGANEAQTRTILRKLLL